MKTATTVPLAAALAVLATFGLASVATAIPANSDMNSAIRVLENPEKDSQPPQKKSPQKKTVKKKKVRKAPKQVGEPAAKGTETTSPPPAK